MAVYFKDTRLLTILLIGSIFIGTSESAHGQDIAQLAMRARTHLYDSWNFDSVAYYFGKVIGKKHAPAFAYSDYGWYLMLVDRYEDGLSYIQQAAVMAPSDKQLAAWNAWALLWSGDIPKAMQWIDKALAIDPLYGEALHVASLIASEKGDHNEAIMFAEKAASVDPNWRAGIPLALAMTGNREQVLEWSEKIAADENVYDTMLLVHAYDHLRDTDKALEYLQKSYHLRHPFMPWLKLWPGTEHLRHDPRFELIVQKMNLPE